MQEFSETQIDSYRRDGYIIAEWRLPLATLQAAREALERLLDVNGHMSSDAMFCPHLRTAGVQGLKGDDHWLDLARTPEILDMVGQLIGPDFLLWGTTVFGKPAARGKETPWHQDGEYWPIRPLATCSAWIALDDATPENGCLRVLPGSHVDRQIHPHHRKESDNLTLHEELDDDILNRYPARDIVLEAGQMSFHDVYLAHGSAPNHSGMRRAGYVCRYMPTSSVWDREIGRRLEERSGAVDFSARDLYLMRGSDRSGQNEFAADR